MEIRPMQTGDFEALTGLWNSFPGTTMTDADSHCNFLRFLEMNGAFCFTALGEKGSVIGSVMAGNDGRRGYIYHLAVEDDQQGKGLGRMLMEAAETSLRSAGVEKAHLFIYCDNPAISFYQRLGWHRRTDIEVMSRVLIGEQFKGTRRDRD